MAVSWDGRVSLIGFRGVAIGSPATAAAAGFRRSSEETRGKGGESDGTKLVQLEFVAFERGVVGTFSPMLFQLLFHALFFFF